MFTSRLCAENLQLQPHFLNFLLPFFVLLKASTTPSEIKCGIQPFLGPHTYTSGVTLNFSALESFTWLLPNLFFFFKHKPPGLYTIFNTSLIKAVWWDHTNSLQLSDSLLSILSSHLNILPFLYSYKLHSLSSSHIKHNWMLEVKSQEIFRLQDVNLFLPVPVDHKMNSF